MKPTIIQKPTVAIVGRTNVGKSTLFNRLIEEAKALVSPIAGTTRSPNYGEVIWRGRVFTAIDTGGLEKRTDDVFAEDIRKQADRAMREADIILFLIDLKVGILPQDRELAKLMAKTKKSVLLVGNKAEKGGLRHEEQSRGGARALGFQTIYPISAVTGQGVGDLLDAVFEVFAHLGKEPPTVEEEFRPIKVAIIGRPNVGKSSLLNSLVGAPRAVVSEIPHTTREPQDTLVRMDDLLFLFVDTAGIRKKLKRGKDLTAAGIKKSLEEIRRADLVLLVVDLAEGISADDRHLAGLPIEDGRGLILIANKWDLLAEKKPDTITAVQASLHQMFPFLAWAPVEVISAKTAQHVHKLYSLIARIDTNRKRLIDPQTLDEFFRRTLARHKPSRGKGKAHPFIYSMKQVGAEPPVIEVAIRGRRESVHPSYLRFLENRLREKFDFIGTPIIMKAKAVRPTT